MNVRKTCVSLLAFCFLLMFGVGNAGALSSSDSTSDTTKVYKGADDIGTFALPSGAREIGS